MVVKVVTAAWRVLRSLLFGLAALVLFIEEWGWRPLTGFAARIVRWPPLAWLEARIAASPPRVALLIFLVPAALLFPLKLAALWLIKAGHATLGIAVIVAAKVIGTAFVGRLFIVLEPQLMTFAWFAKALAWSRRTKARVHAAVRRTAVWRLAGVLRRAARSWWRRAMQ